MVIGCIRFFQKWERVYSFRGRGEAFKEALEEALELQCIYSNSLLHWYELQYSAWITTYSALVFEDSK